MMSQILDKILVVGLVDRVDIFSDHRDYFFYKKSHYRGTEVIKPIKLLILKDNLSIATKDLNSRTNLNNEIEPF